jgi:hypothetical protein
LERPKVKLPRVKCSFRLSTQHLSEAIKELQEFFDALDPNIQEGGPIKYWPVIKRKIAVVANWYSTKYEIDIKNKVKRLESNRDELSEYERDRLASQLACMNSTGPKVQLKNDHLDKSLHMYLSNAKKKVPTPPLLQDQGKSSRSIQGNLEAFVMEYSKISSQPHTCRAAQRQLLDLIPEEAKGIFEEFHTTDEIHPSEVLRAIKQMNSTTAPGEDGIRLSVYAALKGVLAPFLAKLYTEMIQTGEAPANFFDGTHSKR